MSATAASSPPCETSSLDGWERALLDRQLEALGRLADMGMSIAAEIERRATANAPESDAALRRAPMDFARVSRAIRMTFALQSRLIGDFKGRPEARSEEAEEADDGRIDILWEGDTRGGLIQRREMRGIVRRVAQARGLDGETLERLEAEARERLEDDDVHQILMTRSTGEVLALICADLGLEPDWDRVSREAWAQHEIARRPPGSPFIGWMARRADAERPLHPSGPPPPRAGEDAIGV
jgi:hypothetical protein